MNDDDGYSPDEAVHTGGVRTELRGDVTLAQAYLRPARRMLGALRNVQGINARIAAGEVGGYYKQVKQFDDGTYVEVISHNGNDTVRITAPVQPTAIPTGSTPEQHTLTSENAPTHYAQSETRDDSSETVASHAERKEEEEETDDPRTDYKPYLWVGARIVSGNDDDNFKLHACIWEPEAKGKKGEILSNRNDLVDDGDDHSEDEYPLQPWKQFAPADDKENGIAYTDQKLFMLLERNGYPMRVPNPQQDDEDTEWDVIFISDPDNDLQIDTPSGPMAGVDTGGTYYVKVMVVGPDCGPERHGSVEVEVRIITGKDADVDDARHQFTIKEFTSYKMGILPLGWFPEQDPPDPEATECDTCSEPVPDYGSNRHGPHWWQGMATVELAPAQTSVPPLQVAPSTTTFTDDEDLPPTGFWPSGWFSHLDLCPACASEVTGVGVIAPLHDIFVDDDDTSHLCGGWYRQHQRWVKAYGTTTFNATMKLMKDRGINSVNATDYYDSRTGLSYGLTRTIAVLWDGSREHYEDQEPVQFKYSEESNCAKTSEGQLHWDAYHLPEHAPDPNNAAQWEIAHHGSAIGTTYCAFFKSVIATDQHGNTTSATLSQIGVHEWNDLLDNPPPPKCVRVEQDD